MHLDTNDMVRTGFWAVRKMSQNMEYTDTLPVRFECFLTSIDLEYILVCRELHCHLLLNIIIGSWSLSRGILHVDIKSFIDIFGCFLHLIVSLWKCIVWNHSLNHGSYSLSLKGKILPKSFFFLPINSCFSHAGWGYNYHTNEGIGHSNWWGAVPFHKTLPHVQVGEIHHFHEHSSSCHWWTSKT